jgi:hypothetical protein
MAMLLWHHSAFLRSIIARPTWYFHDLPQGSFDQENQTERDLDGRCFAFRVSLFSTIPSTLRQANKSFGANHFLLRKGQLEEA